MTGWADYYDFVAGRAPRAGFLAALDLLGGVEGVAAGHALDLGFGDGVETRALLAAGWTVTAVDVEPAARDRLLAGLDADAAARVDVVVADLSVEEVPLPPADLVHASLSLFFLTPAGLSALWPRMVAALRPGGVLAVDLLGERDTWAAGPGHAPVGEAAVDAMLGGLDVVSRTVLERDGDSFGGPKHWHVVQVLARSPR